MTYKTKKKYFLHGGKSDAEKNKDKMSGKKAAYIPGTRKGGIIGQEKKDKKKAANKVAKQARKDAKESKKKAISDKKKEKTQAKLQSRKTQLMDMLAEDIEAKYGKEFREGQVGKATKGNKDKGAQGQGAQGQGAQGQGAEGQDGQGQGSQGQDAQDSKDGDKTKGAKKSLIFLWAFVFGAIVSFNLTKKEDRSTTNPF